MADPTKIIAEAREWAEMHRNNTFQRRGAEWVTDLADLAERQQAKIDWVLARHHDAGESQGDFRDPDGTWRYTTREHCCYSCGMHGEYGVEWPCEVYLKLTGDQS